MKINIIMFLVKVIMIILIQVIILIIVIKMKLKKKIIIIIMMNNIINVEKRKIKIITIYNKYGEKGKIKILIIQ